MAKVGRTNLIRLIDWMRKNREMVEDAGEPVQLIANKAANELGFHVPWRTIGPLVKDLGFERGDKVQIQTSKFVARMEFMERSLAEICGMLLRGDKLRGSEKLEDMQRTLEHNMQS